MPGDERPRTAAGRTWLGAVGVGLVAGSLVYASGPLGLLVGGVVALAWYVVPGPYAVAVGHVLGLPAIGGTPTLGVLVALEAGFLAVLAAPVVRRTRAGRTLGAQVVLAAGLGAVAWLGWRAWRPRWLVGLALVGLVAVGLYGVHRYAVVRLELRGVGRGS